MEFYYIILFAVSYITAFLIERNNRWTTVSTVFNGTGTIACVLLLKIEMKQVYYLGFNSYLASLWNVTDLTLIMLYLCAYLPLDYLD